MNSTIATKIISRAAGKREIQEGEILWAQADLVTCPEVAASQYFKQLKSLGVNRLWDPDKFILAIDHYPITHSPVRADLNREVREFVKEFRVKHFFDAGREGIAHQFPVERGMVQPGMLVVGGDTHCTTLGGVGALSIPVNAEMPIIMALGKIWLKVPRSIKVDLAGKPATGVMSRDLAQFVIGKIGDERADYRVIEYCGEAVERMDIDERMTLCNVVIESGAKTGIIKPSPEILASLKEKSPLSFPLVESDSDAVYEQSYSFDAGKIEPQVALPPSPDNVVPVSEIKNVPIHQAFIGSCASGRMEDLRMAARILKGRKIHPAVRMIIIPGSRQIQLQALKEGLIEVFLEAHAIVSTPSCGGCSGVQAFLSGKEVCIGTGTRNEPGRMGSFEAQIYLASAATVAASAITGEITDPRKLLS
jgi:3-isopropylmalate/(R)-2-methylmalate dehydratase large subunit